MSSHKRKYQEEVNKNEPRTPQIQNIKEGLFTPLTPQTLGLISLCSEIESDIAILANNAEETLKLKNLLEKNTKEKLQLIKKIDQFEMEITEKDCIIKQLEQRLSIHEENEQLKPIKTTNTENIQSLKAAILKYQEENKKYKNINSNVLILKEQLESSNARIQAQETQLKDYKSWIDRDRPAIISKIEELEKNSKRKSKENEITLQELNSFKMKHDLVLKDFQNVEEHNATLKLKTKAFTEEFKRLEEKLAETIAYNSRAIKSRDAYKDILDSYGDFSVTDSFVEKCLKERCKKMEALVIESDDQCTKLQVTNSLLHLSSNIGPSSFTPIFCEKCKSDIKNYSKVSENDRILHLSRNPHEIYEETITQKYENILVQNDTINKAIKFISNDIQNRSNMDENKNYQYLLKSIKDLPSASELYKTKEEASKFKTLAARYKQVCAEKISSLRSDYTKLLGYGIEYQPQDNSIRLTSIYSQTPEQYLIFKKSDDGKSFQLINNQFLESISESTLSYKDFPAFNSAVNLELYKATIHT